MHFADLRVSAAADTAPYETGKQISWPVALMRSAGELLQTFLSAFRCFPQVLRNDTEFGHLFAYPLGFGVVAWYAAASRWILDESLAVPDEFSDVQFVIENAVTAPPIAVYCCWTPGFPRRAGDPVLIQLVSDCLWRLVEICVFVENPSHDESLGFVD